MIKKEVLNRSSNLQYVNGITDYDMHRGHTHRWCLNSIHLFLNSLFIQ